MSGGHDIADHRIHEHGVDQHQHRALDRTLRTDQAELARRAEIATTIREGDRAAFGARAGRSSDSARQDRIIPLFSAIDRWWASAQTVSSFAGDAGTAGSVAVGSPTDA